MEKLIEKELLIYIQKNKYRYKMIKETKIIEKLKENKNYQIFNTKNKIKFKNIE